MLVTESKICTFTYTCARDEIRKDKVRGKLASGTAAGVIVAWNMPINEESVCSRRAGSASKKSAFSLMIQWSDRGDEGHGLRTLGGIV
jgi:hypothetical protein